MTFGAFISTRRKEAKLNLRDTAKHLGISNGYLCDIEQGRRPAPEGAFVERISSFLELDKQEHEMLLDLAADSRQTVPADLPDYIRQHDIVRAALRVAKEVDATDEEWKAFMEMLQNRQNYAGLDDPTPAHRLVLLRQKLELEPENEETLWELFESAVTHVCIGKGGEISLSQKDQKECAS